MGFPRQEYWSGLPFPSPGGFSDPGIEPTSPALVGGFFTTEPPEKLYLRVRSLEDGWTFSTILEVKMYMCLYCTWAEEKRGKTRKTLNSLWSFKFIYWLIKKKKEATVETRSSEGCRILERLLPGRGRLILISWQTSLTAHLRLEAIHGGRPSSQLGLWDFMALDKLRTGVMKGDHIQARLGTYRQM